MPHRILFVNPVGVIGGAERSLLDLLRVLDRRRFDPHVLLLADGPLSSELTRMNVGTTMVPTSRATSSLSLRGKRPSLAASILGAAAGSSAIVRLARQIRKHRPSIVHTNGLKAQLLAGPAARLANVPAIWHLRDLLGRGGTERLLLEIGSRCANTIIANSNATRLAVEARASCPVITIHNGVDADAFTPAVDGTKLRQQLGLTDQLLIGMAGMLAPWKGQHVFLRAAQRVVSRHPRVHFAIVGDEIYTTDGHGGYRAELARLTNSLGLDRHVSFTGYLPAMPEVIAAFDVLVHASVRPEPFGRVLIEGMACAKPVIASNAGGVPEVVVDGETGVLVPPGDAPALAEAIERLITAPAIRNELGRNGRARVTAHFSSVSHARAIERLYEGLVPSA